MGKGGSEQVGDKEGGGNKPKTFRMMFPVKSGLRPFSVEGCSGRVATWTLMWVHFWHRHVQENVVIMEESNLLHPRFSLCELLVPLRSLKRMHRHTSQFRKGAERKRQILKEEEERLVIFRAFSAYGRPLEMVIVRCTWSRSAG